MSGYYLTNNLGGGGTNVSRFIVYRSLLNNSNVNLLLNYYYLENDFKKNPGFDQGHLKLLKGSNDICNFLNDLSDIFVNVEKKVSTAFMANNCTWRPKTLLDSGSGNILRDLSQISSGNYRDIYKKLILDYHTFAERLKFDKCIAFDFAGKYTYKKGEMLDDVFKKVRTEFENNIKKNIDLLEITLELLSQKKLLQQVYVPLHGGSEDEFLEYYQKVVDLENKHNTKFSGMAIGGIGQAKNFNSDLWGINPEYKGNLKSNLIISKLVQKLRKSMLLNNDSRPIHILGAGGIRNLPTFLYSGVDSYDCHTPWRRSSDGNKASVDSLRENQPIPKTAWSMFLIPLVNSNFDILPNNPSLKYIDINKITDNLGCDCTVCKTYPMKEIKRLYCGSTEDNYFAKILIFSHSVWQYDFLWQLFSGYGTDKNKYYKFIEQIKDSKLANDWSICFDNLD